MSVSTCLHNWLIIDWLFDQCPDSLASMFLMIHRSRTPVFNSRSFNPIAACMVPTRNATWLQHCASACMILCSYHTPNVTRELCLWFVMGEWSRPLPLRLTRILDRCLSDGRNSTRSRSKSCAAEEIAVDWGLNRSLWCIISPLACTSRQTI